MQTDKSIKLLLLDDHSLFRESLSRLLCAETDFEVIADCHSSQDALAAVNHAEVDVILLDHDLGNQDGLGFLGSLRNIRFAGKVLFVTAGMSVDEVKTAMQSGAAGIFLKHSSPADLLTAIRRVAANELWLDPKLGSDATAGTSRSGFFPNKESSPAAFNAREQAVLDGVFAGLTNKEIAAKLNISESYVKAVLQQLFAKTGVRTRSRLVLVALETRFGRRSQ